MCLSKEVRYSRVVMAQFDSILAKNGVQSFYKFLQTVSPIMSVQCQILKILEYKTHVKTVCLFCLVTDSF